MTDDLASFLNARLDEDEHWAQMATAGWPPKAVTTVAEDPERYAWMPTDITPSKATFILRHDPARVLREVEAGRKLLAEHKPDTDGHCWVCLTTRDRWKEDWPLDKWPCRTIRTVAAVYSDHPDYCPEWAPDALAPRP